MPSDDPTVRPSAGKTHVPDSGAALTVRFAMRADAPELVRLRGVMFESFGVDTSDPEWRGRCQAHLEERLADGRLIGAVVDHPQASGLVASALAEVSTRIPAPSRPTGSYAYVSSVSTDRAWRGRGMARAVVSLLLDELRRRGVRRVELHATPDGEPLYRSFGFLPRPGAKEMALQL
jgi:ribosomal protein S18 acetylase RimI-like enzyme